MNATTATRQVLIVEDDPDMREGIAMVLTAAGHEVRTAANGLEALRALRDQPADLILLDLVMPVMDGWTFRTYQLLDPDLSDIPVIVLSSTDQDTAAEIRLLGGIRRFFRKGVGGYETLELVNDLLDLVEECAVAG